MAPGSATDIIFVVTQHRPAGGACHEPGVLRLDGALTEEGVLWASEGSAMIPEWAAVTAEEVPYWMTARLELAPDLPAFHRAVFPVEAYVLYGCDQFGSYTDPTALEFTVPVAFEPDVGYETLSIEETTDNRTFAWTIRATNHGNGPTSVSIVPDEGRTGRVVGAPTEIRLLEWGPDANQSQRVFQVLVEGRNGMPSQAALHLTAHAVDRSMSDRVEEVTMAITVPGVYAADSGAMETEHDEAASDPAATVPGLAPLPLILAALAGAFLVSRRRR
jgi:hypothetical protein